MIHVLSEPRRAARRYDREETLGEDAHIAAPDGTSLAISTILPPR